MFGFSRLSLYYVNLNVLCLVSMFFNADVEHRIHNRPPSLPRGSGSFGSKSFHPALSSVSSSSLALKQMLEQKKKNQESGPPTPGKELLPNRQRCCLYLLLNWD